MPKTTESLGLNPNVLYKWKNKSEVEHEGEILAEDITYLKTGEGWMYLAIVMYFFSRRVVGSHLVRRMTADLVSKAMIKAYNFRQPPMSLAFHSDRGFCPKEQVQVSFAVDNK